MIGVMLAVLHSLGMFIIDVFKSRRRGLHHHYVRI